MTNYASNFTPRVRATYVSDNVEHSVLLRAPAGVPFLESDAQTLLEAWRNAMAAVLGQNGLQVGDNRAAVEIIAAEYAQEDEDLFLPFSPVGTVVDAGDDTSGNATSLSKASLISITGKTVNGKSTTLFLWGPRITVGSGYADWRLGTGELTGLAGVMAVHFDPAVPGSLANLLAGPDGQPISFFRQRVNVRVSAAAINRARG